MNRPDFLTNPRAWNTPARFPTPVDDAYAVHHHSRKWRMPHPSWLMAFTAGAAVAGALFLTFGGR